MLITSIRTARLFIDPKKDIKQHGYDSTQFNDARRFEDEPEPTEDDQIKNHYLKHHPMYEFRNFEELHVDGYLHWLHGRADYFNSQTYTKESPWEMGSKPGHVFFLVGLPIIYFHFFIKNYKNHC